MLPLSFDEVEQAAWRVAPHVRRTPAIAWTQRGAGLLDGKRVTLKLEHLQVGGSFKARGAVNRIGLASPDELARGVATASGGNHGIGVAYAASRLGARAVVYLPETAPASSEARLRGLGARTVRRGAAWDDAWALAESEARATGALLVHPFEDPAVIAGQGTVALELLDDAPDLDAVIVAIGGGGLIGGVALTAKSKRPATRVIGVEPVGAPSMHAALSAGHVVALPEVRTIAGTLAPRAVGPNTLALAQAFVDEVVLVSDDELRAAMRLLWDELRILVEPSGAAAIAALMTGRADVGAATHVGVILCGANLDVGALFG